MALIIQEKTEQRSYPWPKGQRGNPNNLNLKRSGLQEPGPRAKLLCEKHGVKAILAAMEDPTELDKYSTYDAMLIIGLANSLKGSEQARENMLNRMFGKVPDKQVNLNINVDADPEQLSDKAQDLLAQLSGDDSDLIEE